MEDDGDITPALNTVPSRELESAGVASGVLSTAQQVGGALRVAVIGPVFFSSFHPAAVGRVAAAGHAFAVAVFAVVVGLAVLLLSKRPATRSECEDHRPWPECG
ncbi:hypothetical protein GCM10010377_42670 [Streptomyces viridiviolaceus]|uniref:Major facilitator superfamily (MFS) profile domain-containing protein n=1 Tax=Streptomyces viridiviolaceus TaxID=68282 RepID=A0ABW2EG91_9ACTN|nr:hypothetical protein [Streptomyces viridiviolaceus]GHB47362.1 hypothetical protein GCM10010377_42670 [Streptomyces viridiviolaceus]